MVFFRIFFIIILVAYSVSRHIQPNTNSNIAIPCDLTKCIPPSCRCSSTIIPGGLNRNNTPQFVLLTFDDGVTVGNNPFYQEIFNGRKNRDGCPAAGTFFVSHEYTDYTIIHHLYKSGHEIALHSITHNVSTNYWKTLSVNELHTEFGGERKLISKFASIPLDAMQGIRLPFLQMSGDNSFEMLAKEGFLYDCSWPTRQTLPGLWPYTLDYESSQDCLIGPCPRNSWKNVWVAPMLTWLDGRNEICAMVDACLEMPDSVDKLVEFMIGNFNATYHSNKAPFGFFVHSAWFNVNYNHFLAYFKFVDYLQTLPDVYIVGITDVIDWVKNAVPLSQMQNTTWSNCTLPSKTTCKGKVCRLSKNGEERYLSVCGQCPKTYPWIGNPLGI